MPKLINFCFDFSWSLGPIGPIYPVRRSLCGGLVLVRSEMEKYRLNVSGHFLKGK